MKIIPLYCLYDPVTLIKYKFTECAKIQILFSCYMDLHVSLYASTMLLKLIWSFFFNIDIRKDFVLLEMRKYEKKRKYEQFTTKTFSSLDSLSIKHHHIVDIKRREEGQRSIRTRQTTEYRGFEHFSLHDSVYAKNIKDFWPQSATIWNRLTKHVFLLKKATLGPAQWPSGSSPQLAYAGIPYGP